MNNIEIKNAEAARAARHAAIRNWHPRDLDSIPTGYLRLLDGVLQQEVRTRWQRWDDHCWEYEERSAWQNVPAMFSTGIYPVSPADKVRV